MGRIAGFVAEARRRRVFRTAGLYVVGAWVLLQVADLALQSAELPDSLLRYFWLAAFAGFPVALIFGWYYEITPDGIRKTLPAGTVADEELRMGVPDYVIIGALAVVVAVFAAGLFDQARQARELAGPYDPNGIAVLPLANLSGSDSQEYFSAGMHDALITNLSRISELQIVSRASTAHLDRSLAMSAIGRALGVRNVIEGSVTREGNRVRVIIQLIDAAEDVQIWAGNFEREFTSVLALQNEMAMSVARAVDVRLSDAEETALSQAREVDPDVYDAYLRGMYFLNQVDNRVRRKGIRILEGVVDEGKADARVYASLAYGYAVLGHSPFPEGMYPASKMAARAAMELDDSIAEVHLAIGMHHLYYERDMAEAEKSLLRALELNPSLTGAHFHYAWLMELLQRSDLSLPAGERTIKFDPLSPWMRAMLAAQYANAGQYARALELVEEALELQPGFNWALSVKGQALLAMGDIAGALEASSQIASDPELGFWYGVVLAGAGRVDEAREVLAGIDKTPRNVIALSSLYAALGEADETFYWLNVAREVKLPWYPWLITWYLGLKDMRDEPRMRELAEELGLSEALDRALGWVAT